jgi:hypothetical protein
VVGAAEAIFQYCVRYYFGCPRTLADSVRVVRAGCWPGPRLSFRPQVCTDYYLRRWMEFHNCGSSGLAGLHVWCSCSWEKRAAWMRSCSVGAGEPSGRVLD